MQLLKNFILSAPPVKQQAPSEDDIKQKLRDDLDITCQYLDWRTPCWTEKNRVHNWRNYATPQLIAIWSTFSDEQKRVIAFTLDRIAEDEHWE
ncbi:hypothetical protein AAH678_30150 [Sodalis endosymbiont of Spalangia cameroni]|uniref:hypothetical protein n=1 Tax=Sodalis praecaptivus TaxID=1239307 RepID=UPI0031F7DA37